MNPIDLKRILTAFADTPADVDMSKGKLLVQIRDSVIAADIVMRDGEVRIREDGTEFRAAQWIVERIARVSQLADRILSYVDDAQHFVTPSASLLDELDRSPDDELKDVPDAIACARELLTRRPAGTTSVLYLTSNAGEGKTTVINHVARLQAEAYKRRESDVLVVPIALGGRPFLRFDDVVVGSLVNRFRFQGLYFDAFIELVRLGVIVPAFDGFEEMFVESASGEALSALGNLVRSLDSSGSVLISARTAYFEYRSFATQAKLFDAVGTDVVSFSRLALRRWDRRHFLSYASKRHVPHAIELYEKVQDRLGEGHPVLSRAVLVKRLLDVAAVDSSLQQLLTLFGEAPQDYFFQFVNAIIEREVREKWIDRSGEPAKPLLTIGEQHELLSLVAQEMWLATTDALRAELLDLVAEMFSEAHRLPPMIARQVRERLKQHSLIANPEGSTTLFSFDHDDFRLFFLGEALGKVLVDGSIVDLQAMLRVGTLPGHACDSAIQSARRRKAAVPGLISKLIQVSSSDLPTSFTRENCGALLIRILDGDEARDVVLTGVAFPPNALRGRSLRSVAFKSCYFQNTSVANATLDHVLFSGCHFDELEVGDGTRLNACRVDDCEVVTVSRPDGDIRVFDPDSTLRLLAEAGFTIVQQAALREAGPATEPDEETEVVERAIRLFLRASHVNQDVFRLRLGTKTSIFTDRVLPELLRVGVLEETQYAGSGRGRRFRLAKPMQQIDGAMRRARGSFQSFVAAFE